jgi:hypothetical protein
MVKELQEKRLIFEIAFVNLRELSGVNIDNKQKDYILKNKIQQCINIDKKIDKRKTLLLFLDGYD